MAITTAFGGPSLGAMAGQRKKLAAPLPGSGAAPAYPAAQAATPNAALPGAQTSAAPLAPTSVFGGPISPNPLHPLAQVQGGVRGQAHNIGSLYGNNARRVNPYLWSALQQLVSQANTNRMSDSQRAAYLGPQLDQLQGQFGQAQNSLTRSLSERGLGDSSGLASGLGALASGQAGAQSGLVANLTREEQQRQLQAQDQLRAFLAAISGQGTQGANILQGIRGQDQTQQQIDNSQKFDWGGLLSGLLGAGGSFLGAGGLSSLGSLFGGLGAGGGGGDPVQNPAIYKNGWSGYS